MPPFSFIESAAALRGALSGLRDPVAVDTEFHPEYRYFPRLMLVQLRGAGGREIAIDARAVGDLHPVGEVLSGRPLVLHAAATDLELLARHAGLRPGPIVDTQVLAGFAGMGYPRSLSDLQRRILGGGGGPSMGLSDWSRRPLSERQLRYAMEDVRHLHALADALIPRAGEGWVEATAERVEAALSPVDPEGAWLRIPAAEVLDGRGREVLRRLAAWRERRARESDRPAYQIASNAALIDVARRRPRSVRELQLNRKMPRGLVRKHGERLIGAVIEAESVPEDALPESVATTAEGRAVERVLEAWAAVVELRDGVASRLVMPGALRRSIAGSPGEPLGERLGWRRRWEPELSALLGGRAAIAAGPEGFRLRPRGAH